MKDFAQTVPQGRLNIEVKSRSNIFAWRGQFSPQLIETLLDAYCLPESVVLDPFAGSGTVLLEAAMKRLPAFGYEVNPAAWSFCKLYEFANILPRDREGVLCELRGEIEHEFPIVLFSEDEIPPEEVEERIVRIAQSVGDKAKIVCNALVVLLDIYNNRITGDLVQSRLTALSDLIRQLPYTEAQIKADLQDARLLPLGNQSIDFIVTSPPYINVFNYHQNNRRSAELLGWDLLRVARSEIGSNRANRGNRFLTVVLYSIDMATALQEMARVLKPSGRAVLIVGYESRVLGTTFRNAEIVNDIANELDVFTTVLRQQRVFTNRFGQAIREDVLNLSRTTHTNGNGIAEVVGRSVASKELQRALAATSDRNKDLLVNALSSIPTIKGTSIFNSFSYEEYQTRDHVMMVKERKAHDMTTTFPVLPTPHLAKLKALLKNRRLPKADRPRVGEALKRYQEWIHDLEVIKPGHKGAVRKLVDATNRYKQFIELDLIFDSPGDFLYRQKGQLKLDNTMFQEAVATSRDLKMAVPASLYFLVCEFLDMTPVSITSTHIDDVLIVRKAKRMSSNVRQEYRSDKDRKKHRAEYVAFHDQRCVPQQHGAHNDK